MELCVMGIGIFFEIRWRELHEGLEITQFRVLLRGILPLPGNNVVKEMVLTITFGHFTI